MTKVGIDKISFYVPKHYLALDTLAEEKGIDPEKFARGIGQNKIAVPSHDEDVVTIAAEAASNIVAAEDADKIDTVLFATETGIDQSKAAGVYVHRLLDLPSRCRVVELKHACYSGTAALQLACGHVTRKPDRKVLVIASDISRYDLGSPAEATQGCGAVAMLVSADPGLMEIEAVSGCHSEDIMDFWRPNHRKTPLVDGKYSTIKYLQALSGAWDDFAENGGRAFNEMAQFCYHLPFTAMGVKAHRKLSSINEAQNDQGLIEPGMVYNREVGNCYAASLYLSLTSMLENVDADLSGRPVGLFSYGSGAVAEFFSAVVQPGYRDQLMEHQHRTLLSDRTSLSYQDYVEMWHAPDPHDGLSHITPHAARGRFRLTHIDEHKRHYAAA
ncbi:MAG: hydroxymethylglutaryl-CoA synthase [Marinovum sp.]|nr:hydroxymethylglutaryl-CoA synthase [Marinovum sp.]